MRTDEYLTYRQRIEYNKGIPIKCGCGRVIGFIRDGKPYVICHSCKGAICIKKGNGN